MKKYSILACLSALSSLATAAMAADTGPVFYGDAPDEHHPWAIHDRNRPQPKTVTPGSFSSVDRPGKPPSDAIVLFDGTDLSQWESTKQGNPPAQWLVKDGLMEVTATGAIRTKEKFGDCQLHVEFATPKQVEGSSQGRGNSGIFLMGMLEVQVLDSYNNPTYADGGAGSYYGVNPPLVNAVRPPGEFQIYDIVFRRPIYRNGQPVDPGYITVFLNGLLVQDHTPIEGPGGHMGRSRPRPFPEKGPLELQDHGNPTRFRNIWYRELPPRSVEGGTDGYLTAEATLAQRKEIAATIRQSATQLSNPSNPAPEMWRLWESLEYENDQATHQKASTLAAQYVENLKKLPAAQLATKKDEVKQAGSHFKFLAKFKVVPADFAPAAEIEKMIKDQGWDKKR